MDVSKALPLTVADWRELQKKGATLRALRDGDDIEAVAIVVGYVLEKAQTGVDVNTLTLPQMTAILAKLSSEDAEVDRPT